MVDRNDLAAARAMLQLGVEFTIELSQNLQQHYISPSRHHHLTQSGTHLLMHLSG